MANKTNKYGRQIFLSREEIEHLRRLVFAEIVEISDILGEQEDLGREPDQDLVKLKTMLEKLVDDNKGKLWYYISQDEAEARGV